MGKVIEESEKTDGTRIATVQSERGQEFSIQTDVALSEIADLLSDLEWNSSQGWHVGTQWFYDKINKVRKKSIVSVTPFPEVKNG